MIKKDELITMNDGEYFILETLIYDGVEYGFANKIDENDEPLNIYKLIYNENGINKVLEDEKIINILLPLFEELITKEKIDSIEKQMDTLFHQITQTKDDITRKNLVINILIYQIN